MAANNTTGRRRVRACPLLITSPTLTIAMTQWIIACHPLTPGDRTRDPPDDNSPRSPDAHTPDFRYA